MRVVLVFLLVLACGKPCPYVCASDADCPLYSTCFQHEVCLQGCMQCPPNGPCVDSFHNCGACGNQCAAGQKCGRLGCVAACETGLTDCSGSCYDLMVDRVNCGACSHRCADNENCITGACRALQTCG